jgi:hypothetical protein
VIDHDEPLTADEAELLERIGYLKACETISLEAHRLEWSSFIPGLFSILLCRRVRQLIAAAAGHGAHLTRKDG